MKQKTSQRSQNFSLPRKPRRDLGSILATARDLILIAWIAHMHVVRLDHLRWLMSLNAGGPMRGQQLALSTVDDQIRRWRTAGWVVCERFLANQPQWVWVTAKGLRLVSLDDLYDARKPPSEIMFKHSHGVNAVRLFAWAKYLDVGDTWISERQLLAEQMGAKMASVPLAPIQLMKGSAVPDALVLDHEDATVDAIEVERTPKEKDRLERKLSRLIDTEYWSQAEGREYVVNTIHYYVPTEAMRDLVLRARATLDESDQANVKVHLWPHLSTDWHGWPDQKKK
jgi:hypothetical protein